MRSSWRKRLTLRPRLRRRSAAFTKERLRQATLARAFGRGDQRQIDDVALGVAAADSGRVIADG